jgi:hypothetical protein
MTDENDELAHIKKNFYDNNRKNTVNFREIKNLVTKEEILEKFKYMIKKLNRKEIIKIFELIKSADINLLESDIYAKYLSFTLLFLYYKLGIRSKGRIIQI